MNNYKIKKFRIALAFLIGVLISSSGVYAATTLYANKVAVDKSNGKFANVSGTKVQDVIEYLYNKVSNGNIYNDFVCPGCVYRKSSTGKYNINSTQGGKTSSNVRLTQGEYTTDYSTLNSNYFLGHIIDSYGYILESFACGITDAGIFFCLRAYTKNETALTYKPTYQENINTLARAFPGCNPINVGGFAECIDDSLRVRDSKSGIEVNQSYDNSQTNKFCAVFYDGVSYCGLDY